MWRTIRQTIEDLDENSIVFVGYVRQLRGLYWSQSNSKLPGIYEAIKFLAENHLQILFVTAARLGIGLSGTKIPSRILLFYHTLVEAPLAIRANHRTGPGRQWAKWAGQSTEVVPR